jgi:hypothetical protein
MPARAALLCVLGATMLAAGCGGDDDAKSTTAQTGPTSTEESKTSFTPSGEPSANEKTLTQQLIEVRPSAKTIRLAVTTEPGSTTAFLTMSVREGSGFEVLKKVELSRPFRADSKIRPLDASQKGAYYEPDGGQGLVSWEGATEAGDYAEYFGWNVETAKLELFGVGEK